MQKRDMWFFFFLFEKKGMKFYEKGREKESGKGDWRLDGWRELREEGMMDDGDGGDNVCACVWKKRGGKKKAI